MIFIKKVAGMETRGDFDELETEEIDIQMETPMKP